MATTKGLILGKFMPPHNGHKFLIETAAKQVDELTVLVCSIQSEPIKGVLRYAWMKALFPHLRVLHVTDENPQEPADHPDFWEIWTNTILKNCPDGIDIVFTSEDYGDELAKCLQAQHVLVDKERATVPISASKIRNSPFENWEYIPKQVRSYFIKRVVLTGPESTGKTVLSKQLAEHFQTVWVSEYGRQISEERGDDLTPMDFAHIAGGQLVSEDKAAEKANKVLFCDTDLIVTEVWGEIFMGQCPTWIIEMNHLRRYDLFLLLSPDIPWIDDGTRGYSDIRERQYKRIKDELVSRNLPYVEISGSYTERFNKAVDEVKKLLKG